MLLRLIKIIKIFGIISLVIVIISIVFLFIIKLCLKKNYASEFEGVWEVSNDFIDRDLPKNDHFWHQKDQKKEYYKMVGNGRNKIHFIRCKNNKCNEVNDDLVEKMFYRLLDLFSFSDHCLMILNSSGTHFSFVENGLMEEYSLSRPFKDKNEFAIAGCDIKFAKRTVIQFTSNDTAEGIVLRWNIFENIEECREKLKKFKEVNGYAPEITPPYMLKLSLKRI